MINWYAFKVKHPNYREAFEELCYLLFCREHNIKQGIDGRKNQTGIETEPIKVNGKSVGWQAKFFDNKIDKRQIINSIRKAKEKNPELCTIYIYTNQKFPESPKKGEKKTKKQKEIEELAKSLQVEIVWRVESNIKKLLSDPENKDLREHYFNLGKTTYDSIEELFSHTQALLKQIHIEIDFDGQKIRIDRVPLLKKLENYLEEPSIVILSGDEGTGKTALIKELYLNIKEEVPMFVFKANEFNVSYLNEFFCSRGTNFHLTDFIGFFEDIDNKIVVIDSAEKIPNIENQEPIKEFVSVLIDNDWSVIFTTRYEYFDDLLYTIVGLWRKGPEKINIDKLTIEKLKQLSIKYNFTLPTDKKLLQLIRIPFYLNEYLQSYKRMGKNVTEEEFKRLLWNIKIQGISNPNQVKLKREKCFIEIAVKKANDLNFVVDDIECEERILKSLEEDGIIRFDKHQHGYFITHDIYEEWALERYIEGSFNKSANIQGFFNTIGDSLAMRRAFRKWLSGNIRKDVNTVRPIIDSVMNDSIAQHWRDEIIVSIQLTPHSEFFYDEFKNEILSSTVFLEKTIFLTRVACREADKSLLEILRINPDDSIQLEYLMSKPKGEGWKALIKFLYQNRKKLNLNTNIIIGLLQDWVSKNKTGKTTRYCGLLGIYLLKKAYEKLQEERFYLNSDIETNLSKVILHSANEIKEELQNLFDEVLQENNYTSKSKYSKLAYLTLTSFLDFQEAVKALPEKVIELTNKFWYQAPGQEDYFHPYSLKRSFCLNQSYEFEYSPASAFQTPIYFLLKVKPFETLKFIIDFVNKTIACYTNSRFKNEVEIVDVYIDGQVIKQFASDRLWNMYRGTAQPSPDLLRSIHMALEKWLLEVAKELEAEKIEDICKFLLKNSKSASITAVVTSIVLAYPVKTFNIAKILFKTRRLFFYDKHRKILDTLEAKSLYSIGYGLNYQQQIHRDERLKTCEDKHRKWELEDLVRYYQCFRTENITDEEVRKRQEIVWEILDNYYNQLPDKSQETDDDKTWRLFLARTDYRKQKVVTKELEEGILFEFQSSQIDNELKKYSEEWIRKYSEFVKNISLELWSKFRFEKDKQNYLKDDYKKYEENPLLAFNEAKEILDKLKTNKAERFIFRNKSIPIYVYALLIRDFFGMLNKDQKEFCKEVIFENLIHSFSDKYIYQTGDGIKAAVSILPEMVQKYPDDKKRAKELITAIMFCGNYEVIKLLTNNISNNLWEIDYKFSQSLFLGFLYLKPKYWDIFEELQRKKFGEKIYSYSQFSNSEARELFIERYEKELESIINCNFDSFDNGFLSTLNEHILIDALCLLPNGSNNETHVAFVTELSRIFCQKLFAESEKLEYELVNRFLEKITHFILASKQENIDKYIQPFIENLKPSLYAKDIFEEFVLAEDRLNQYDNFWYIWNKFYSKIVELFKEDYSHSRYHEEILQNYLLAFPRWKKSIKEWHSLKDKNKVFYRKISNDLRHCPIVLYSISKILNDIGSKFLNDGIYWISGIIETHGRLLAGNLKTYTTDYLERFIRKYILMNRQLIKTNKTIKNRVLIVLNFLINQGSSGAYLMREDIL